MLFRTCTILAALTASAGAEFAQPAVAQDAASQIRFAIPDTDETLPGEGPMRRAGWFRNVWNQRRTTFADNAQQSQGAVVFLGDSITQGWRDDFRGDFGAMKVANRGISGDTTRGMLWRLQEDVLALQPAAVVLLMGTNDLEESADPATVAENIERIIEALKEHNAEMPIIYCNIFPSSASKKRPADKIKSVNQRVFEAVAGDPQVTVLDTWTLFANDQGDAKKSEFPDLLHPNGVGYAKWRAAIHPLFATLGFVETQGDDFDLENDATSLFNGKDLTGWQFVATSDQEKERIARTRQRNPKAVVKSVFDKDLVFDGQTESSDGRYVALSDRLVVTTPPEGRRIQQLWTTRQYNGDFTLKLEFRATPNADSGVFVRGKQLQCRDYLLAGPYKDLKQYRAGDWNELVIRVRGTSLHATCNGEILEEDMQVPETGRIGLEGDRGQIEYRRIRLLPFE